MNIFLTFAFLFYMGSTFGWILELFYRRFFSRNNPDRKWINPGFCVGPYLPLYGTGLCFLYFISSMRKYVHLQNDFWDTAVVILAIAVVMTLIEYVAGIIALRCFHIRLWDYSQEWGNLNGIICPKFSFYWALLGVLYYFWVQPNMIDAVGWLAENLAFSFVIGLFFGFFIIDAVHSTRLITKLKALADEYQVVVRYEELKIQIRDFQNKRKQKYYFFRPLHSEISLANHISALKESFEERKMLKADRKKRN